MKSRVVPPGELDLERSLLAEDYMKQAKQGTTERRRVSFEEICMRTAGLLIGRSTCDRLQVGCVIASSDYRKILAWGYNGNASGLDNKCDSEEPGKCGCLHAEENAVINCDSPRQNLKIVFCTHEPCKMCAKRLVNLGGVVKVYYCYDYRLHEGLEVLYAAGIPYEKLELHW